MRKRKASSTFGVFRFFFLFLIIGLISTFGHSGLLKTLAAPSYNGTEGTWTDLYTDNTGLTNRTNVNVDTPAGVLKLTNASGQFSPPYSSTGSARTTTIMPPLLAEWGEISFSADIPEGTSITIRVMDEGGYTFSETQLPGNSAGFTTSPVDISSIPIDQLAMNAKGKIGRIKILITLQTTNPDLTPSLDALTVSWTVNQGDLSPAGMAQTEWATLNHDTRSTAHSPYSNEAGYSILKWTASFAQDFGGNILVGPDNNLLYKTYGGYENGLFTQGRMASINRDTGVIIWSRSISGNSYSSPAISLSSNGTIHWHCIFSDVLAAYDQTTGAPKWMHAFSGGHTSTYVNIGQDGTIYTDRTDDNKFTVYAFNPDGTVKWSRLYDPPGYVDMIGITLGLDDTVYQAYATYSKVSDVLTYTNEGMILALDPDDGSEIWSYATGDVSAQPVVDEDGTIYVANANKELGPKRIIALNPNGTLKWESPFGTTTNYWSFMTLRSDNVLLAGRAYDSDLQHKESFIDAVDTTNGEQLWSHVNDNYIGQRLISDGSNGFYYSETMGRDISAKDYTGDSAVLNYFDSEGDRKWKMSFAGNVSLSDVISGEDGKLFINHSLASGQVGGWQSKVLALNPWTLMDTTSVQVTSPRSDVVFSAVSSMPAVNPLNGAANKVQIVTDAGDLIPLQFDSYDENGRSVWSGRFTIPSGTADGEFAYSIEASAANVVTDTVTHFELPAAGSENSGMGISGNGFSVVSTLTAQDITTVVTSSGVTISWTTNDMSSTQVEYGISETYGYLSQLKDEDSGVVHHSVELSSLAPCSTYHFRIKSVDQTGIAYIGEDLTVVTTGCPVNMPIVAQEDEYITALLGGEVSLHNDDSTLQITLPPRFSASDVSFQIKKLDSLAITGSMPAPLGRTLVGGHVYHLSALTGLSSQISYFNLPISFSLTYSNEDISNTDEASFSLYSWDGAEWDFLADSAVNTDTSTVSATNRDITILALFGTVSVDPDPADPESVGTIPVYRFWSDRYRGHFYTVSSAERDTVIATLSYDWRYEGEVFRVPEGATGFSSVYRFWSDRYRGHFYTISLAERNSVIANLSHDWAYEGVAFFASTSAVEGSKPLYRFWSDRYKHHFYTSSEQEKQYVVSSLSHDWTYEGVAYWVY